MTPIVILKELKRSVRKENCSKMNREGKRKKVRESERKETANEMKSTVEREEREYLKRKKIEERKEESENGLGIWLWLYKDMDLLAAIQPTPGVLAGLQAIEKKLRSRDGFDRRSLGLSGHHSLPTNRESENRRPKKLTSISSTNIVFKNLPDENKSNKNNGLECGPIGSSKDGGEKKGVDEIDVGLGPKPDSYKGTSIRRPQF
ncbi:unnamed protein product [Dovyalis caffra]|uniref:Uncharacterized protein n=1 Tax=Dovyalis caffra TaxID=77055 RepID=A0AAV1SRL8_9ROSI|nr:unnamed protein product [Dovyalis caffra]